MSRILMSTSYDQEPRKRNTRGIVLYVLLTTRLAGHGCPSRNLDVRSGLYKIAWFELSLEYI
jgi:hypothetical protein